MAHRIQFNPSVLRSVVGGKSAIDTPFLNIHNLSEADAFISGYGFRTDHPEDLEKLWYYHRRALVLMEEKLKMDFSTMPDILKERRALEDIRKLLIFASLRPDIQKSNEQLESLKRLSLSEVDFKRLDLLQKWSCALLRCIHVFVHAENDLFASFAEEIQKQILSPFQSVVFHDGTSGKTFLQQDKNPTSTSSATSINEGIELFGFEAKPFKTSTSTVIKYLAKPDALAISVLDKVGVRFVTRSVFDTFRVVRFLVDEGLVSYPHIIPNQSNNTIYPVELFLKACVEISDQVKNLSWLEIDDFFRAYLLKHQDQVEFLKKENQYSGADYRFIKFIVRKLIRIEAAAGRSAFTFFYPFEVQIIDQESQESVNLGPAEHHAYKDRQVAAARARIFPESV